MLIKRKKIPVLQIIFIGLFPSFLKKFIYRIRGYKVGENVSFGLGSVIIGEKVTIGNNSSFGFLSVVRAKEIKIDRFVQIGAMTMIDTERVFIGDDSRINEQVIIGGIKTPESIIRIGKRVIIMEYSFINPTKPITIGDDTGIGGHCLLFTHGSWLNQLDGFPVTFASITIGKNVWLPWRVFIMPGTEIGDNVVIGANSLVSKTIASNTLIAGSPAKVIKENYPSPVSSEEKQSIINNIFADFIKYLKYEEFKVNLINHNNGFSLDISKQKKKYSIHFLNDKHSYKSSNIDCLYILNYDGDSNTTQINSKSMVINLVTKERKGSSNVGEEFTKYLSRHGIRFDRID